MESPVTVDEKESSFFENKYAEDFEERDAEVVVIEEDTDNKEATIIVNRVARDIHLMRKEHNLKFQGSPLGRHTPKILPHPIKGKSIGVFIVSQHNVKSFILVELIRSYFFYSTYCALQFLILRKLLAMMRVSMTQPQ